MFIAIYNQAGTVYELLTLDEWLHSDKLMVCGEEVFLSMFDVSII